MPETIFYIQHGEQLGSMQTGCNIFNSWEWVMFTLHSTVEILGVQTYPQHSIFLYIELIQSVGSVTGVMIPCCVSCSRVCFNLSLIGTCTRLGACCTGWCVSLIRIWYFPSSKLIPGPNTLGYCLINCSLVNVVVISSVYTGKFPVSGLFSLKYEMMFNSRHDFLPSNGQIFTQSNVLQ